MKTLVVMPKGTGPMYPGEGKPCNQCGICCKFEPCSMAKMLLQEFTAPCRALEFHEGKYWCGIVRDPTKYVTLRPEINADDAKIQLRGLIGDGRCDTTAEILEVA